MGGSAVQIRGTYNSSPTGAGVSQGPWGVDVQPPKALKRFHETFGTFVHSFGQPWDATKHILDYISYAATVGWRKEPFGDGEAKWDGYIGLSGCAGMAQTSAYVTSHWIHLWATQRPDELPSIFSDFGFGDAEVHDDDEPFTYFPTTSHGYAYYWADAESASSDDDPWAGKFDIDAGAYDHLDDGGRYLSQRLESNAGALMSDGQCRCQLCDPTFSSTQYAI